MRSVRDRDLEDAFAGMPNQCDIARRLDKSELWPCPSPAHKRVAVVDGNGQVLIRLLCRYHWRLELRAYRAAGVRPIAVLPATLKRWRPV